MSQLENIIRRCYRDVGCLDTHRPKHMSKPPMKATASSITQSFSCYQQVSVGILAIGNESLSYVCPKESSSRIMTRRALNHNVRVKGDKSLFRITGVERAPEVQHQSDWGRICANGTVRTWNQWASYDWRPLCTRSRRS